MLKFKIVWPKALESFDKWWQFLQILTNLKRKLENALKMGESLEKKNAKNTEHICVKA